jgi:hypothetical protein
MASLAQPGKHKADQNALEKRLALIAWFVIGIAVIYLFWPALWRSFSAAVQYIQSAEGYATDGHDSAVFFNGYVAPDGILGWKFFISTAYLPVAQHTVVLLGLLIAIVGFSQEVALRSNLSAGYNPWIILFAMVLLLR